MKNNIIISYLTQRKLIGILGIALAFICMIGGLLSFSSILPSISDYYYSNMRDVFVAVLTLTGAFLLTYKGYSREDNVVTTIAGISAILIGFFPMTSSSVTVTGILQLTPETSHFLHATSAIIFFFLMAYMSYFLFTKTNKIITQKKKKRNKIYRLNGIIIIGAIFLLIINTIFSLFSHATIIMEIIMLIAFSFSWLVKGEAILKDVS